MTLSKTVRGDLLLPHLRAEVLRRYTYRLTIQNGYPAKNPCKATVPAVSDDEWLRTHAFYVTSAGKLAYIPNRCEYVGNIP